MNTLLLTPDMVPLFRSVLPPELNVHCAIFGCIRDGAPCGAAVLEHFRQGFSLSWLWVRPDDRAQGVGSQLLDQACEHAVQARLPVSIAYPSGKDWTPVLDYMLARRGFSLEIVTVPRFVLTRQQLLDSPYYQRMEAQAGRNPAVALSQLQRNQLGSLRVQAESADQFLVSRTSFSKADPELSSALLQDGRLRGLTLIRDAGEGRMVLELMYLASMTPQNTLALLYRSAAEMLRRGLTSLEFVCVSDNLAQLAEKLSGAAPEPDSMVRGMLYTPMYRKGGR